VFAARNHLAQLAIRYVGTGAFLSADAFSINGTELASKHLLRRTKTFGDWKNGLQIRGAGRKSRKPPTLTVGIKPYGKSQLDVT